MGKNATKAIVTLLSGKIFSPKKLSTGGGKSFNMLLSGKIFGLSEHYCPWPPKKHGSHGATEIIAPRISSWQSGIIKQPLIQQIAHAAFDPLGVRQHFPCDSNF
jgi:hypothetical protein